MKDWVFGFRKPSFIVLHIFLSPVGIRTAGVSAAAWAQGEASPAWSLSSWSQKPWAVTAWEARGVQRTQLCTAGPTESLGRRAGIRTRVRGSLCSARGSSGHKGSDAPGTPGHVHGPWSKSREQTLLLLGLSLAPRLGLIWIVTVPGPEHPRAWPCPLQQDSGVGAGRWRAALAREHRGWDCGLRSGRRFLRPRSA